MTTTLPDRFRIRLRPDVFRAEAGRVLAGGSPARVVRLADRARNLLADGCLTVDSPASAGLARRLLDGNLADPVLDEIETDPRDLTVVVPARDRSRQLHRCLSALGSLSVVVVDDHSRDPAAIADVAVRHGAHLIPLSRNLGPAGARNAGLAQVGTPLVAFVDSDVVVDQHALLDLARHCADPRVALVGPAVVGKPRTHRPRWFETYDAAASSLDLGRVGYRVRPGAAVAWLPSACLVGRVDLLGTGFDPDLRVAEDVDLVWRLVADGLTVRYDPDITAHHDVRSTVCGWLGRKFVYGTGGAELGIRHGDNIAPAAFSPTMAIGAAALMQRRWWSLPLAAVAVATTARSLQHHLPVEHGGGRIALRLAARGLGWAVRQETGLLLRHWWPVAFLGAMTSRQVRRAILTSMAVDLYAFFRERPCVNPATALVARRLDDLAYGTGLWWGAIRRRNVRCIAVRVLRPRS